MRWLATAAVLLATGVGCEGDIPTLSTATIPPASTGSIVVTVETHGIPSDSDGYIVNVRGRADPFTPIRQRVAANGNATFSKLQPDLYTVSLEDVAPPCVLGRALDFATQFVANVRAGQSAGVAFEVDCSLSGTGR